MKKFFKNIILFLIPILLLFLGVYLGPYESEFGYQFRKNAGCNTEWIHDRLFNNPTPIDVAFLGTSHTGCGINDSKIEELLRSKDHNINVANLAYCKHGRNIQWPIVKDLLEQKKPRVIFLGVSDEESYESHQDFAYIADVEDVFSKEAMSHLSFFENIYQSFFSRLSFQRKYFTGLWESQKDKGTKNHSNVPFDIEAEEEFLNKIKIRHRQKYTDIQNDPLRNLKCEYPKSYLSKIANELAKNNVKLIFLYLPSYGSPLEKSLNADYYKELGELWMPPKSIFEQNKNWVDSEHLNKKGSTELAIWLSNQYRETF